MSDPLPLLMQPNLQRFFTMRVAATAASQMLMVALGWQIYDLTGSAWDLGLVGLYQFLPALVLALLSGHVVDRFHRARIVAVCLGMQALIAALLMAATAGHWATRELLLLVAVLLGTARAFQMPAQQALTPLLVPEALLARADILLTSRRDLDVAALRARHPRLVVARFVDGECAN